MTYMQNLLVKDALGEMCRLYADVYDEQHSACKDWDAMTATEKCDFSKHGAVLNGILDSMQALSAAGSKLSG